ncbi:hypothetical protein SS50377_21095 [Spironucleus salmonicida]|uniref:Tetratricopeptide repeat protein 21A/21B C-terminal ARM domain-containing protein n=2 Tax=Spironucleus TaxID=39709 RepID=V6LH63_9EUKA|nr:hypothetical protein SS50377_21095 [Spironucleus salmonicida]|eukprot:EST43877.1 hypothetical protein SS50377_16177 [Spironucleus salmonicida]
MDEFVAVLYFFARRGELARCQALLTTQAASAISADTNSFISAILELAQNNSSDFASHQTATSIAAIHSLVELLSAKSQSFIDTDRVTILQSQFEIEVSSLPQGANCLIWFVCGVFGVNPSDYIKSDDEGPIAAIDQFLNGNSSEIKNYPMLSSIIIDLKNMKEIDNLFEYLNKTKQTTVKAQVSQLFKHKINVLVANLATANFLNISEAISSVSSCLQDYTQTWVGRVCQKHQTNLIIEVILGIARAYPAFQILLNLAEFLNEKYPKNKDLTLLQGYLLTFASFIGKSPETADLALQRFKHAQEAVLDDQKMILSSEGVYSVALALTGRVEEAKSQVNDDDEAEELLKLLINTFQQQPDANILNFVSSNVKLSAFTNTSNLYNALPDTLIATVLAIQITEFLQNQQFITQPTLHQALNFFESTQILSPEILECKFLILQNLQNFDSLLKQANILSNYSAIERNFSLNSNLLLLFASSASQLLKVSEAAEFASQAQIVDSNVMNKREFKLIQAKISYLKGNYIESSKYFKEIDSTIQCQIHICLLKIKGGDLSGFKELREISRNYPNRSGIQEIEFDVQNADFIAMNITLQLAISGLFILRKGGYLQNSSKTVNKNSFDQIIDDNSLLFFENQQIIDNFREALNNSFSSQNSRVGNKYFSSNFGVNPINLEKDVFYAENIENIEFQNFSRTEKLSINSILQSIQNYAQFSLEITELISQIQLVILNDKLAFVSCFTQLSKQNPSTTQLAALASAHLAVGNAQFAVDYYQKSIEQAVLVIKTQNQPKYIEILIKNFLFVLKSRALSRCHKYQDSNQTLMTLIEAVEFKQNNDKQLEQANLIAFSVIHMEYMKLLIKLRQHRQLFQLCDSILKKSQQVFSLPSDSSKPFSVPFPVTILSIYCARAKAELIKLNQVNLPTSERLDLLGKAVFWVDSGVISKTQRVLVSQKSFKMQMQTSVFSSQTSKFEGSNDGLKALVLAAEVRVEIAEIYLDLSKIDIQQISQTTSLTFEKKQHLTNAFESAKISLKQCETARANNICAIYHLFQDQNYEMARANSLSAKEIEPFNNVSQIIFQAISHKINFGGNEVESEQANTPFEDSCRVLKIGLNVDRVVALDNFLLNSCLVHDMTVVTDALFKNDDDEIDTQNAQGEIMGSDISSLDELNDKMEKVSKTALDGYFYLGRGFLQLKMGRINQGMKDLMLAVNSQTLSDRYRARALYLLGTIYVNPNRQPLFGSSSCLTGKQQSAVALQKQAMQQQSNINLDDQAPTNQSEEDQLIPDTDTINQREDDLSQALQIVQSLQQMYQRQVQEARELFIVLKAYIRIGQYRQAKDRIARITLDEGKAAKSKLNQLELLKDQAKTFMQEAAEELHQTLQEIDKNQSNYVVILFCLGNIYCHLKNDAKSRSNFQNGARQIISVRDQGNQGQIWLDLDAAVQCNLALADQYIQIGKIANALKCLDGVASLDKIQTISYELYGLCQEKEAAYGNAVSYYESAWLLSHGSPSVAYRLAYNYMKAQKYAEAILMCQNALSEYPGFNKLKKEVLYKAEAMLRSTKQ